MVKRWTQRRVIGVLVVLALAGAISGAVALRLSKKDGGGPDAKAVTLEFAPDDLTRVAMRPLARWLPVSGALQPVNQAPV